MGPCFSAFNHEIDITDIVNGIINIKEVDVKVLKKSIDVILDDFLFEIYWSEVEVDDVIDKLIFAGIEPKEEFYNYENFFEINICSPSKNDVAIEQLEQLVEILKSSMNLIVFNESR